MHLTDYIFGQRLRLQSLLTANEVEDRVNRVAESRFSPFASGVVGGVLGGRLRLQYRGGFFEYNAKPVLYGTITDGPSGAEIALVYRAPTLIFPFYLFWYAFLTLVLGMVGGEVLAGRADPSPLFAIPLFLFALPVAMHYGGTSGSNQDLEMLLAFLAEEAEARPAWREQRPSPNPLPQAGEG